MRNFFAKAVFFILCLVSLKATAASCPTNTAYVEGDSAVFVSQLVPAAMAYGKTYSVSVSFCNNGSTSWKYLTPPATGNYSGTTSYYRLASQNPANNLNWGAKRVDLAAGDNIAPGQTKTFTFNVKAPVATGSSAQFHFQWGMVREQVGWLGMAPSVTVADFYTPTITLANKPLLPPVALPAGDFTFAAFAGANVINESYIQAGNNHRGWIPNADQMALVVAHAGAMGLKYLRLPVVIPPDAKNSEFIAAEWYPVSVPQTANQSNLDAVINATQTALRIAQASGLKVIVVLDGYTEYDTACAATMPSSNKKFWKKSFDAVQANAATVVRALSSYPAVYAWDLMNEPLWNASAYGCLDVAPNSYDRASQRPALALDTSAAPADQAIAEVVEAVHAMYNLVRANDPANHPTTVGEGQAPYLHYWNDISSFASPHIYISPQNVVDAQIQANSMPSSPLPVTQFGGAPNANNLWHVADPLIQAHIPGVLGATIAAIKNEITTGSSQLPLIVGEFGVDYPNSVASQAEQAAYYTLFLTAPQNGLQALNVGNMLWDLSTGQQGGINFSLLSSTGTLLPAACVAAKAHGAKPSGC